MNKSESIKELAAALAKAQGQIHGAKKDTDNPFFKSKYADLASVWDACRQPLSDNGLCVTQMARSIEGGVEVETMLMHASGEFVSESLAIPVAKQDAQGFGSALTYCRRYGLSAIVGIAPEDDDDDGNAAAQSKPSEAFKPQKPIPAHRRTPEEIFLTLSLEQQDHVSRIAGRIADAFLAGEDKLAYTKMLDAREALDKDEFTGMWSKLEASHRRVLKEMGEKEKVDSISNMGRVPA